MSNGPLNPLISLTDDREVILPYILSESKLGGHQNIHSIYEHSEKEKSSKLTNSSVALGSKSRFKKERLSNMLIHTGAKK